MLFMTVLMVLWQFGFSCLRDLELTRKIEFIIGLATGRVPVNGRK